MDQSEFEVFYRQHWPGVLGFARRRTESSADAADITAEIFVVAWRRRQEMPEDGEARLWLFGVARHTMANHQRGLARQDRLQARLLQAVEQLAPDPAEVALDHENSEVILAALRALPEADRELLMLVGWDGLTPQQAAQVLKVSPALARVRLHRARQRLDRALRREQQGETRPGPALNFTHPHVPAGETT